jgi:hypothetical protein
MPGPGADMNFTAKPVEVQASNATPEAAMANITANQAQLQKVNDLTSGGGKRRRRSSSHIRTYKGRKYMNTQRGGAGEPAIVIPQAPGQATCTEGASCAGMQNANLTATLNQSKSSSANDGYVSSGGGRRSRNRTNRKRGNKSVENKSFLDMIMSFEMFGKKVNVVVGNNERRDTKRRSRKFAKRAIMRYRNNTKYNKKSRKMH